MWSRQRTSCGCTEVSVTLSLRGGEGQGVMESKKEVGSAALVQLLIWFSISRTCQRALLSSLTVDWLPRNVFLSPSLSFSLSLWTELACFGVLLSHIFAHGLTKCAEKRRQHFVYFCTQPTTTTTIKTSSTRQHMAIPCRRRRRRQVG